MENVYQVTVVMAVYNSLETLARAIESVINQSYKDWLMIVNFQNWRID